MKHFIVLINYIIASEEVDLLRPEHRKFLKTGYDKNILLLSGPRTSRTGGVVVAKSNSVEDLKKFFKDDPYSLNSAAEYEFLEFTPGSYQNILNDWINEHA